MHALMQGVAQLGALLLQALLRAQPLLLGPATPGVVAATLLQLAAHGDVALQVRLPFLNPFPLSLSFLIRKTLGAPNSRARFAAVQAHRGGVCVAPT